MTRRVVIVLNNMTSSPPAIDNSPFSLVGDTGRHINLRVSGKNCFYGALAVYLYMDTCEKPAHACQNLSAVFERLFQLELFPVLMDNCRFFTVLMGAQLLELACLEPVTSLLCYSLTFTRKHNRFGLFFLAFLALWLCTAAGLRALG